MSDGCHLKPRGAPPTFGRRRAALVATPSSSLITTSDKTTSAAAEFSFKCITGAVPGMNRILGARRSAKTRGDGGQGRRLQRRETAERKEPHIGGAVARQIADQRVVVAVRQGEIIQALVDRNATTCFRFTCLRRVGAPLSTVRRRYGLDHPGTAIAEASELPGLRIGCAARHIGRGPGIGGGVVGDTVAVHLSREGKAARTDRLT